MTVIIREAQPTDAAAIISYMQQLAAEPNITVPLTPGEFNMTVEQEQQLISDFAQRPNCLFLLAEADDQIVGVLTCEGAKRKVLRHTTTLGISVAQGRRDQGIGRLLMQAAIDWARRSDVVTRIALTVYAINERAIHLYSELGFQREGYHRHTHYQHGGYIDMISMALLLEE